MQHQRITLFAGHYGSGKTNIAVNYAIMLAGEGKQVCIADLDIVNPYFRTADSEKKLNEAGVHLIRPQFANTNIDLPALPAEAYRLIMDKSCFGVMDIGGDDRGAYALGRYVPAIIQENDYQMVYVVNFFRPLTANVEDAREVMHEIEAACSLRFTAIINNSNLGNETTAQTLLDSISLAEELSKVSGLPILAHCAEKTVALTASECIANVMPLQLQDKYFDLPV